MDKDILVAIIEDDLFSRNWMSLLLVRDWRTRVMGEVTSSYELATFLEGTNSRIDILLTDVDIFGGDYNYNDICQTIKNHDHEMKILCTGVRAEERVFKQIDNEMCCGYILKQEIGYSLGWALSFASDGNWLLTPGTLEAAHRMNYRLPNNKMILSGRKSIPGFTERESEVARLAFIFSLGRRDLADELKISEQWSYGLVSELYEKLGLGDILSGEVDPVAYLGDNTIIQQHFKDIMAQLGTSKKAKDLETLAFHFMTMPDILN